MAEIYLYFLKYSSVRGMTTSQMKVHPATKNGYLLKKSSIATNIDSRLILSETWSEEETTASEAKQGREVRRLRKVKDKWVLAGFRRCL